MPPVPTFFLERSPQNPSMRGIHPILLEHSSHNQSRFARSLLVSMPRCPYNKQSDHADLIQIKENVHGTNKSRGDP
jgi:hypothetical protein